MIIPPSPTNPRSPLARGLRIAGLALAPVLLVAAVGIGLAGPKPEPAPTPRPTDAAARSGPSTAPSPALVAPSSSPPPPDAVAINARPPFPDGFEGLDAIPAETAVVRRASGGADGAVVVTGWMKVDPPGAACDGGDLGQLGPWCARTGILAQHAWAVTGADFDPLPAHLHVTIPLGVRLPDPLVRMATADAGPPLPVMVIGRFTGTRCAPADLAWCEEPFVVDRVAWADGVRAALTPLTDDNLSSERRRANPFATEAVTSRTPLLAVLAWPPTIAALDPATSTAVGRLERSEPVWYLRVVGGGGRDDAVIGGSPGVRWLLLDEKHLAVLATGRTSVTAAAAPVTATRAGRIGFPVLAGRLGVVSLGDARAALAKGTNRPAAVAGFLHDVRVSGTCAGPRSPRSTMCTRTGLLSAVAPDRAPEGGGTAGGLRVHIPAGVRLPAGVTRDDGGAVAVVVVVRPRRPDAACGSGPACDPSLDVDGVPWAAGAELALRPVIDSTLGPRVRAAAQQGRAGAEGQATGVSGTVLMSVLVPRSRLSVIDAAAAAALAEAGQEGRPVWYVRALEPVYGTMTVPPGDITPRVRWIVADAATGTALAGGVSGS